MSIEINSKKLAGHLNALRSVIERRETIPTLMNVLIESVDSDKLKLTATDLDHTLRIEIGHEGDFEGAICVRLDRLHDLAKSLPECDLSIDVAENGWAEVESDRGTYKLAGAGRESYPDTPIPKGAPYECEAADLLDGLSQVTPDAATQEHTRWEMRGVLFEVNGHLRFVATDGGSLSVCDVAPAQPFLESADAPLFSWFLPRKTAQSLAKAFNPAGKITCWADDNHFAFQQGGTLLTSRRMTGKFPDYKLILNTADAATKVDVDTAELRRSLEVIAGFAPVDVVDKYRAGTFEFGPDELTIRARSFDGEEAEETIDCRHEGELKVRIDLLRVRDALKSALPDSQLSVQGTQPWVLAGQSERIKTTQFIQPLALEK